MSTIYVLAKAARQDQVASLWVTDLFRRCLQACASTCDIGLIDEVFVEESAVLESFSLRITGDDIGRSFAREIGPFFMTNPPVVEAEVIEESSDPSICLDLFEIEVSYFQKKSRKNSFVSQTDSNVQLLHRPTGVVVRCQSDRSRARNHEQALRLLQARIQRFEKRPELPLNNA